MKATTTDTGLEVTVKLGSPEEGAFVEVGAIVLHVDRVSGTVTLSTVATSARAESRGTATNRHVRTKG